MCCNNSNLEIGQPAPVFEGEVYFKGSFKKISLNEFKGKYVVLFFYPLDFTFVCPTEILAFNEEAHNFEANNAVLIGCSVDSKFSHMRWSQYPVDKGGIGELNYPLLTDITKEITKSYKSLINHGGDKGVALRSTFIIDTNGILRQMSFNDLPVGRNVQEVLRLVKAFQYTDEHGEVCPSKWKGKGDATMKPSHDDKITEEYFKSNNPN